MRAGPGLGNIGPEQGDYNQVVKGGGHGNYRNIVVAPNSVQEMCDLTIKAFDLSTKYRNPVVVLADGVLGQMVEPLKFPEKVVKPEIDTSWAVCGNKETYQNLVTSIFLDFDELEEFNYELQEKYETIKKREVDVDEYMMDDAEIVLVSYGISSRICRSAVELARKEGIKAGLFRPITLFPFPEKELAELAGKGVNFISVEMSNGQLMDDIKLATCCKKPVELVNRMGGNLITMDQVLGKIREVAGKEE
ncbi:MAG: 2-oxoisovalerate ferredoxin oxidoreductase, alpha subunit [Methanohalophilus sp.]|nr:MAG: 2-oxoisovalerate ferredoxin oxidoreductase, alpha subunit [Methanohalophilus sp. 2-GBenrich]RSD33754.1 MAG: 2-oxoisovalerate ferredoxin oxidoreductase, alpha subunit [Methanohalophilus sp.]SNY00688.1 ketoisovalerate ferredoxin oxidoreductase, alpha subunit [Methanohalophilus euhalobius]